MNTSYLEVEGKINKKVKPIRLKQNPHELYNSLDIPDDLDKNEVWDLCLTEAKMTSSLSEALFNINTEMKRLK
jgi:hypothetical protein